MVFKIVENHIHDRNVLRLYSLNPAYQPYDVNLADVREVWRFKNFISEEIPGEGVFKQKSLARMLMELKRDVAQIKGQVASS